MKLDKRLTPARPDIAAAHLRGKVEAARFVEGEILEVRDFSAPLRRTPQPDGAIDTELLFGEAFTIYETDEEGWCWGQSVRDSYVGYVARDALTAARPKTHRLAALRSFIYPGPSIKLQPLQALSMNSLLEVEREQGDFLVLKGSGAVWAGHVAPLSSFETDFVAVAERFLHVPYLWGGRTSLGLDCSGLVQLSLQACGLDVARDSDMLEASLGEPVSGPPMPNPEMGNPFGFGSFPEFSHPIKETEKILDLHQGSHSVILGISRGDLVFWKGHVGIMRDAETLLHANGFAMCVTSEPLAEARARILAKGGGDITSVRRF